MEHFEEFTLEGKSFVCIDLSKLKNTTDLVAMTEATKPLIASYPKNSLHTITNVAGIMFDSESKYVLANYMKHNKNYVKAGVIIGIDGIKKAVAGSAAKVAGRINMHYAFTRDQAVALLLEESSEEHLFH